MTIEPLPLTITDYYRQVRLRRTLAGQLKLARQVVVLGPSMLLNKHGGLVVGVPPNREALKILYPLPLSLHLNHIHRHRHLGLTHI